MYSILTRFGDSLFASNHCSRALMSVFKFSWAYSNNSSAIDILVSSAYKLESLFSKTLHRSLM